MSPEDKALAIASAQTRTMIVGGLASCEDGANHIRQSKKAVAGSMRLLSNTKRQIIGGVSRD
jgi:hypothetical protein